MTCGLCHRPLGFWSRLLNLGWRRTPPHFHYTCAAAFNRRNGT